MNIAILIPSLNPDQRLLHLVKEIRRLADLPIIVIDDGSQESCAPVFTMLEKELLCIVCHHEKNLGKGAALKTGIQCFCRFFPDSAGFVTADCHGQYAPEDILRVAQTLAESGDAIVLGIRDLKSEDIPFKWANRFPSFVLRRNTKAICRDTQTGPRGIPAIYSGLCLAVEGTRGAYEANFLLRAAKEGIAFLPVPIAGTYDHGATHFHSFLASIRMYLHIAKFGLSSFLSAIVDLSLFTVFIHLFSVAAAEGIFAATVIARILSGCVNFFLNKVWVFDSRQGGRRRGNIELCKYAALFCLQMVLSWLLVSGLSYLPLHLTFIKMLVDTTLFFCSYLVQRYFIFHRKRDDGEESLI